MLRVLLVLMISAMLLPTTFTSAAVKGLVAFWQLDEGSGNEVKDVSGNGHHGEIKGPKWASGKIGKGLIFAGKDNKELVEVPDDDDLDGMEAMTATAWANITGTGTSVYPRFVTKGHEHSWTFLIDVNAGKYLRFIVNRPGGKFDVTDKTTQLDPFFNKFHHYAVAWDGKDVIFYIDGKEISKHAAGPGPGSQTDVPVLLGNSPEGRTFEGILDEVGLFNIALSQKDIKGIMDGFSRFRAAVNPDGKLSTVWGNVKANHSSPNIGGEVK